MVRSQPRGLRVRLWPAMTGSRRRSSHGVDHGDCNATASAPARRPAASRTSATPTLGSWSRERRVIGKAEVTRGEANPRFVVTSLKRSEAGARHLYEKIYCARGDMENRIRECQLDLFADRTSTATIAGQPAPAVVRLHGLRVLLCGWRRIGLAHTQFAEATCGTIRLKLLKLGCLGSRQRAADQDRDGVCLRMAGRVRIGPCPTAQRRPLTRTQGTEHRHHAVPPTPPSSRRGRSLAGIPTFPVVTPDGASV